MLLSNLNLLATAPGGVARLRELILTLAVQGKLMPQDPGDEPASVLLRKIRAKKDRMIAAGQIKRDKPSAEIAEHEKPFELPSGWCWTRVADICTLVTDGEHSTPQRCDDPSAVPLVTAKNVRHEVMNYTVTDFVPQEIAQKCWQRCKPAVGDILMVSVGATTGRLCVLRDAVEMVLVRSVTVLRPAQSGVIPDFLARHLMSPSTQREIWSEVKQSAQPCLYLAKSAALKIALPPLAEQSRIVTRVEELMRLCDALEAKGQLETAQHTQLISTLLATLADSPSPEALAGNWQRVASHFDLLLDRPEAVDALEQTILQLAVRGLLVPQDPADEPASALLQKIRAEKDRLIAAGKIKRDKPLAPIAEEEKPFGLPRGWEWVRLGQIADNRLGKMLDKAKNTGKRYPYLRNTNVQWRHIDLDDIKEINLEASELEEFRLFPGDLLICEGGYPGRCAIWNEPDREMYFQKALHRVRPRVGIAVQLIALSLESDSKLGNLDQHFTGATIKHFVGQALDRYLIPLPPLAEQSRIVARVESLRRLCADLRQRLSASQTTQAQLAAALVETASA